MSTLPTPLRAALGLAATALDEARKLPETLPQVPVVAVTTAMQASLRVQQHIAALAARGDEVLSQLRGTSTEPPAWATFDDDEAAAGNGRTAAFDRVEQDEDFDTEPAAAAFDQAAPDEDLDTEAEPVANPQKAAAGPKKASATKANPRKASAIKVSATKAGTTKAGPAKAKPVKRSEPLKVAAEHAKPSDTPNPSTMAAEIVQAHEAETRSE